MPMTLGMLAEFAAAGAVTGAEQFTAADDQEESEYAALLDAADASADLLDGPGRRVVLVAEVGALAEPVPMSRVVAVHVDTSDVDPGDDDPPELAWFATQEIPELLG